MNYDEILENGERVLWLGVPKKELTITWSDMFYIIFGSFWTFLAIKPIVKPYMDWFSMLLFVIFAFFGILVMFVNPYMRYVFRKRSEYVVTNQRVIVFDKQINEVVSEKEIKTIKRISKKVSHEGLGTIYFGALNYAQQVSGDAIIYTNPIMKRWLKKLWDQQLYWMGGDKWVPVFYDIEDYENVYQLVNSLRETTNLT